MRDKSEASQSRKLGSLAMALSAVGWLVASATGAARGESALQPAEAFASIADPAARSAALFIEAGKVLTGSRCVNCHPAGDVPLQGDDGRVHEPPVRRGAGGHGPTGMQCATCHFSDNFDPGEVPGVSGWHLAPPSMGWEGLSLAELCAQLKDPQRNGGRDLEAIVEHVASDPLTAWAWEPGAGRSPAPGSQQVFGGLIRGWAESGAICPPGE